MTPSGWSSACTRPSCGSCARGPNRSWMSASRWGRPAGRHREQAGGRAPGLHQTPITDRTWTLTRRELTPPSRAGRRPPEAAPRREFPLVARASRLMLANVLDPTVGAAYRDLLGSERRYGVSPPALRPLRKPPGPSSSPGRKTKQTTKQQHPDPGAVFAFEGPLRALVGSGNTVPTNQG